MMILVSVFLRGGADGLALVTPHTDDALYRLRPHVAVARPDDRGAERVIDLDGRFGLHPGLEPLFELFVSKQLLIAHGVANEDVTRSHFEAQDLAERCADNNARGWIAAHLATRAGPPAGPFAGISVGPLAHESLRGGPALALPRARDAALDQLTEDHARALADLYLASQDDALPLARELADAGEHGLDLCKRLASVARSAAPRQQDNRSAFERRLAEAARMIERADDLGVECITVDHDGWDTHFGQASAIDTQARELAQGLTAFRNSLGPRSGRVLVCVMTEFGRRVEENASLGTDHGHASIALLLGDTVRGGRVLGDVPLCSEANLVGPGDLPQVIAQRSLLAEVVLHGLGNAAGAQRIGPTAELGLFGAS